jgi:hypothetical protein
VDAAADFRIERFPVESMPQHGLVIRLLLKVNADRVSFAAPVGIVY